VPFWANHDRLNHVATYDSIDNIHSCHHASENRVPAVKMWLRRVRDEPLRATSVFAGECHSQRGAIVHQLIDLAANRVSRTPITVAPRVAALDHEVWHNSMKRDVAKIFS